jgi:hypothetical protein
MKAVIDSGRRPHHDFYSATLAPINHRRDSRFSLVDIVLLSVLFLEIAGLMRLFLAK